MTYLRGIDVSLWQTDAFEAANLAGCAFCVVKISQAGFTDSSAPGHIATAKKAGVVVGGYHFLDPEPQAVLQAQVFLSHADDCEFLAVDVEGRILAQGMSFAQNMAEGFIGYVRDHDPKHRKVLMYSSRGTWPGLCGADAAWVADYTGDPNRSGVSPRIDWTFWQYGGTGIDRDYFRGSQADLYAFAGRATQASSGDPMTNLVPMTCHRVVDLAAGTVLYRTPAGAVFSRLSAPIELGLLGSAGPDWFHIADGDNGVYVKRSDATVKTADKNVGV